MTLKSFINDVVLLVANRFIAFFPSHTIRLCFYKKVMGFTIGKNSNILMGAYFDCRKNLVIGQNSIINQNCRVDARGGIRIGNSVSISADSIILTADHDLSDEKFCGQVRPVNIGDFVFIGTRAMILPGVTLGEGSVVAAGAVVTKEVAPYSIVAGVPAKHLKYRTKKLNYSCAYPRLFH